MHAVSDQVIAAAACPQNFPVGIGSLPGPFPECFREIAIVGKPCVHTDRKQLVTCLHHSLTGIVETDSRHIFLKALVQSLSDESGQVVHRYSLFPGKIAQKDLFFKVLVDILQKTGQAARIWHGYLRI